MASLAPDQLGEAPLLRAESRLLADVCAAAAPPLDQVTDLGAQLLGSDGSNSNRSRQQDAVAPLGLGSALVGMRIDGTPLGLAAAGLLFETLAVRLVRATAAVFPLDADQVS